MTKKLIIWIVFVLTLAVSVGFHSRNMLQYPYFESDEGTYTSQAWSLVTQGELAPYTYWYDHPPLGWIVIAGWTMLFEEGFFAFGSSLDTGRVLMLVVHAASTCVLFYIVYHMTRRILPASAAVALFALSPLAIYFQRRVLLDNIMIFWVLLAFAMFFVPYKKQKLRHFISAGVFYAFAVLTKVTAVMFGPAFLFLLLAKESPVGRHFRTTMWFMFSGMVVSTYILFALLQNEFFKSPTGEHVSFLGALEFQSGRDGGVFWDPASDFRTTLGDWMLKDEVFIYAIGVALLIPIAILIMSFFSWLFNVRSIHFTPSKNLWAFLICIITYFAFLIRGGVTFNFYIVPLIPFVSAVLAIFLHNVLAWMPRALYNAVFIVILGGVGCYYGFLAPQNHFTADETTNQKESVRWIKENVENDAVILIDSYAYVDLHDPRYINTKAFPNADWYYKISRDPEIGEQKYNLNWRNFDYIGLTHEMMRQIREGQDPIVRAAFDNSLPDKEWKSGTTAFVDFDDLLSTNGDWAALFKINDSSRELLLDSWRQYKSRFIALSGEQYGQVVDPVTTATTSQGQGYAMLRAAMMFDKDVFDATWGWTRDHLQFRVEDKLFSSRWKDGVEASDNSSDADLDIALALIFASNIWGDAEYGAAAQEIIADIWKQNVITVGERHYLIALNKKSALRGTDEYLVNPSHFSPAWYRVFAEFDTNIDRDWIGLADDTYDILNDISVLAWNQTALPMNWVSIDTSSGRILPAQKHILEAGYANRFSFDAFRTLWRVSTDVAWYETATAQTYLSGVANYLTRYGEEIPTSIAASGATSNQSGSLAVKSGYLSALMWGEDQQFAQRYYNKNFVQAYDFEKEQWNDGINYLDANWAWLGSALYNKKFVNLWEASVAQ